MAFCKSGQILNYCHPNALMTLQEYLEDYASPHTKEVGEALIQKEMQRIPNAARREKAIAYLKEIAAGKRDFRF